MGWFAGRDHGAGPDTRRGGPGRRWPAPAITAGGRWRRGAGPGSGESRYPAAGRYSYGRGGPAADVTTNQVAAEVVRLMFSLPAQVAAIQEDRAPDRLRFTATDPGGAHILDLEIPAGGRATPVDPVGYGYFVAGSHLVRLTQHQTGSEAVRLGGSKARLRLGQHPMADQLRRIGLSPRPLMTIVQRSLALTVDRAQERLAPAEQPPLAPTAATPVIAPMVITHEDGHEETVDQLLDGLPFNPSGTFEPHPEG